MNGKYMNHPSRPQVVMHMLVYLIRVEVESVLRLCCLSGISLKPWNWKWSKNVLPEEKGYHHKKSFKLVINAKRDNGSVNI